MRQRSVNLVSLLDFNAQLLYCSCIRETRGISHPQSDSKSVVPEKINPRIFPHGKTSCWRPSLYVYCFAKNIPLTQEAQLSPTNRPTFVHAEQLPSGECLRFIGRILRLLHTLFHLTPSNPSSYRLHLVREN